MQFLHGDKRGVAALDEGGNACLVMANRTVLDARRRIASWQFASDVRDSSRILRGGQAIWGKPFLTDENNMSHSIVNLEHHHFEHRQFCRPGQVHVHIFGTATLSFADGIVPKEGNVFEISAEAFPLPLRNPLRMMKDTLVPETVGQLRA